MRLESYLITETRGTVLDFEKTKKILTTKCKKSLKLYENKGEVLMRGLKHRGSPYSYYEPKKHSRKSKNTSNYYTLIMDNSPQWKNYPKRSESLICTTSQDTASGYGQVFLVFPVDGGKIGQVQSSDFWWAFDSTLPTGMILDDFNESLKDIMMIAGVKGFNDKSYSTMVKKFKEFDDIIKNTDLTVNMIMNRIHDDASWIDQYNGNILKLVQFLFDPKNNDIRLLKAGDSLGGSGTKKECWTDAPCVLMKWYENGYNAADEVFTSLGIDPK